MGWGEDGSAHTLFCHTLCLTMHYCLFLLDDAAFMLRQPRELTCHHLTGTLPS